MSHIKRYLPSLLQHYLKDKRQTALELSILKGCSFNRVDAANAYLILGNNHSTKASRIVQSVDKYIQQSQKQLNLSRQIQLNEGESLAVLISRLLMLIKYNSHNHQLICNLSQYALTSDQLYYSELILMLKVSALYDSNMHTSIKKLIGHTRDNLEQYVHKTNAENYPYRYLSIFKSIGNQHSCFLFNKFSHLLNRSLDQNIRLYDAYLLAQALEIKSQKPIKFLMRLGMRQNSLVKKRLIYEVILRKMGKLSYEKYTIPGAACVNESDILNKYKYFTTLTQHQQYIDFVGLGQKQGEITGSSDSQLQATIYMDNLYTFIEKGKFKLDEYHRRLVSQKLKQYWRNNNPEQIIKNQDQALKFMIILGYLNAASIQQEYKAAQDLRQLTNSFQDMVKQKYHEKFKLDKQISSKTFTDFLLFQCLAHIIAHQKQQNLEYRPIIKLQMIDRLRRQLRNETAQDKRNIMLIKQFYNYTHLRLEDKQIATKKRLAQVLSYENVTDSEFMRFVQLSQEKHQKISTKIIDQKARTQEKYQFAKNVQIQPNILLPFCFIDKQSKLPLGCFENPQNSQYYYYSSSDNQKKIDEGYDLNVRGIWKKQFLRVAYNSKFYCSKNEMQLSQKICWFIYQNLLQK